MKEIKFRTYVSDGTMRYWGFIQKPIRMEWVGPPGRGCSGAVLVKILSDTMQYIGLKDKNGNEIYEGDIMRDGPNMHEVVYHNGSFGLRGSTVKCIPISLIHNFKEMIVVGNIYDTPWLVKSQHPLPGGHK